MLKQLILFILILMVIPVVFSAAPSLPENPPQNAPDCNNYLIVITKQNQTIENLTKEIDYCKNQSEYYQNLYENKKDVTNKELIQIYQNLSIINNNIFNISQKIEHIQNEFNFIKNVTIFSVSVCSISIVGGIVFWLYKMGIRKRDNNEKTEISKEVSENNIK